MRRVLCVLLCALFCLLCTACEDETVAGIWTALEPSNYYFELFEDGTCMMFDENDEWVSSGTYTDYETYIAFETDTGKFTWVWDEESESMLFEAGGGVFHYRMMGE